MSGFFFRPVDLSALALAAVALLKIVHLWGVRSRSRALRWLIAGMIGMALFALSSILIQTRLDGWAYFATHIRTVVSAAGLAAFVQYIYYAGPEEISRKEAKPALLISLPIVAYVALRAVYHISQFTPRVRQRWTCCHPKA